MARPRDRRRRVAGRAAGDDAGARALLGDGLRLAQGRGEANALPQFITEIDGVDIHFIHVRSKHDDALPMIVTHGWPGSIIEQLKIIEPADRSRRRTAARAADAFDVVIPSLPGHGFSGQADRRPAGTRSASPVRGSMLMQRLGYDAVRGAGRRLGECGHGADGAAAPAGIARHPHQHAGHDPGRHREGARSPAARRPRGLSAEERRAWDQLDFFYKHGLGYAQEMAHRPQTLYAHRGFTRRPRGVDARPRRAQPAR